MEGYCQDFNHTLGSGVWGHMIKALDLAWLYTSKIPDPMMMN